LLPKIHPVPVTLPPIARRRFLALALAGGAGLMLPGRLRAAAKEADPNYFILISDIHLNAKRDFIYEHDQAIGPNNVWANFQQAAHEAVALPGQPSAVIINGDIAFHDGLAEDYATARAAMQPLREAGLPVHWALGNHDNRANASQAAAPDGALATDVTDHRVMVLPTPLANIFIMDSLLATNKTPGLLGPTQLAWLAAALDRHADRPAIVFVHHNPYLPRPNAKDTQEDMPPDKEIQVPKPSPDGKLPTTGSLMDTAELLSVLLPRKHVKVWLFGHTHRYSHRVVEGMHLVNLPATAYPFVKGQPLGWMDMRVEASGAKLQLHCLDPKHPKHNDRLNLEWRA
jgi:Icc protein